MHSNPGQTPLEIQHEAERCSKPEVIGFYPTVANDHGDTVASIMEKVTAMLVAGGSFSKVLTLTQEGDLASAAAGEPSQASARALCRGESKLVESTCDGTLVKGSAVARAWGSFEDPVDAARASGEISAMQIRCEHWHPAATLALPRTELAAIVDRLKDSPPNQHAQLHAKPAGKSGRQSRSRSGCGRQAE